MNTLQEELDRSFGDGPPPPPVSVHVAAGRRALARRRLTTRAAGLAATAVVMTSWYAVSSRSVDGARWGTDDRTPAASPTTTPTSASSGTPTSSPPRRPREPWPRGEVARYVDGELQVRPGVVVHHHMRNPYGFSPPGLSDALDLTWRGNRQWLIVESTPGEGMSSLASTPSAGWADFGDWAADQVAVDGGGTEPVTFRLDGHGRVVPTAGTQVHHRTDQPRLGAGFAPATAVTGAAVVSVRGRPGDWFVVWRVVEGRLDVITTPRADIVGATFDELVTEARTRYAAGEGLR